MASDDFEGEEPGFDFRAWMGFARRQKWTILATVILGVGLGALYVSQVDRQYTATALLVVDTGLSDLLGVDNGLNDTLGVNAVVSTEVEIARSTPVLLRAAEALNLQLSPVLQPETSRLDGILNAVGLGGDEGAGPAPPPAAWSELSDAEQLEWARKLGAHVQVSPRTGTNLISIAVTTTSPTASADWANTIGEAYLQEQIVSKFRKRESAVAFLSQQVDNLQSQIRGIEDQIDVFIMSAIDQAGTPEARALLDDLRGEIGTRDTLEGQLTTINEALAAGDVGRLTDVIRADNPDLVAQRDVVVQTLALETDEQRAAQIRADLGALDEQIRAAATARATTLQAQNADQQETVAALQTQLNDAAVALPTDLRTDLFTLQQDAQVARSQYTAFLTQLRGAQAETGLALADSRVIAPAVSPSSPSYPSIRSTLMMAFLLSAALGVGLGLLRENLVGGIASVEHLEEVTGLSVVASVPRHKPKSGDQPDWAIVDEPLSAFSETIRRARIGIESIVPDDQVRLLVTSAAPGEGKTTIALALARSFAKAGKSTILIDADLRHPSVHKHLNREVEFGLLDYLLRGRAAETAHLFMVAEEATGLNLILGSAPSSVATDALILSQRFGSVIDYAQKEFEVVIIDSPPVGLVVDPQLIAREYATVALFVVKAEATPQRQVKAALRDLTMRAGVPVVGILNQAASKGRYYYGKYATYYK